MSLSEAARLLGVSVSASPEEVNSAYRKKFIENRRLNPDLPGSDAETAKSLNIAKDTLLGVLRPDRGTPQRPSPPPPPPKPEPKPEPEDFPVPEGVSYAEAISVAGVQWYIGTYAGMKTEYSRTPSDRSYAINKSSRILVGKNSSHYVIMKLTYVYHSGWTFSKEYANKGRWVSIVSPFPLNGDKFLKVAPKVIKEMMDSPQKPRYLVLENPHPTEAEVSRNLTKGRLTLKDALLGSGLITEAEDKELDNRKIQVELEPVFDRERYNATPKEKRIGNLYAFYNWYLYFNGRKVKTLDRNELDRLDKKHLFASIYDYNYDKGKVNLTRLRGGRLKYDAKTTLKYVAEALDAGPEKETLEKLSESM